MFSLPYLLCAVCFSGVILFAMLNGRLPFSDGDIPSIIRQTTAKLRFSSKVQLSSGVADTAIFLFCVPICIE